MQEKRVYFYCTDDEWMTTFVVVRDEWLNPVRLPYGGLM